MTTAVKRACDACHRRKVKCDGVNPCRNCSASQLACTYNAIPQKKGPKGSRAKVISELREKQTQNSLSSKVQNRMAGISSPQCPDTSPLAPTAGLLTTELIRESLDFFFANMYPNMPILHRERLEQLSLYADQSIDTYCLLTSLCAFMMLQPGMQMPSDNGYNFDMMAGANIVTATLLLEETVRVRKGCDILQSPSVNTICTSYFLFACHSGLDFHDKAWFYLREATTLVHMMGMSKEETYAQYDAVEAARWRHLYWLLFVTERAYALQRQRPLTLQASINLPSAAEDPARLSGFVQLVKLFSPFDDAFVALWNRSRGHCSPAYITSIQKQLEQRLPSYLTSADSQFAELQMNQQWLKNIQWQMGLASGTNTSEMYNVDIGRDLLPMVAHFPGTLGLAGLGLIEKLCDITLGMTEYLALQPASPNPFSPGPREYLHPVLNVISVLRTGNHHFLPLLLTKVHDVLPRLANPMLLNAPESPNNVCNIDIFDGFGNAGMAQPPMFTEQYDTKFEVPRIEEQHNNDSQSSNGGMSNDMNSPFVSSPGIMSPGGDMSHHGLPSEYNSIPDMMSPMGGAGPGPMHASGAMNSSPTSHPHMHQQQHHHVQQQHQHSQHTQHHSVTGYTNMNPQMSLSAQQPANIGMGTQNMNPGMGFAPGLANTGSGMNSMSNAMNNQMQQMNSPINNGLNNGMMNGVNNGMNNGMTSPMGSSAMNANNLIARQVPQRANSFAMQQNPQIRTIGDFHAVQRTNSDMNPMSPLGVPNMGSNLAPNMGPSIGTDMDFNTMSR